MNLIPYLVAISLVLTPVVSASPILPENEVNDTFVVTAQELSIAGKNERSEAIYKLIDKYANKYSVSSTTMLAIMKCENRSFDPTLQSYHVKNGVREESYGLVQIHLPSHPNVSYEQATDPEFSIEFLAKHLSQGKGSLWTCYRMLK